MSEVNVPKLRFREFEGEWKKYIFKNIVKLQRGSSPRPIVKYITNADDGVNWIKIGDTINGINYINNTEQKITREGAKKSRKVSIGDIILSNSMSYGKPFILNIDGYIHDGWFVIREYENYFHKAYLLQVLGSEQIQRQYKRLAAGGVVNNISSELVNSVKINLPQKPEQQKIANFLTSIDQKIEQLTKKEKLLVAYKKGVMQKIFSRQIRFRDENGEVYGDWVERKLGEIATFSKGKGISKSDIIENGTIECIRYGELYTIYNEVISEVKSKTNLDKNNLVLSQYNDVIIPASGETQIDIATASCVLKDGVALSGDLNIIRSNENGIFLAYYLNNKMKFDIARLSQGISVVHLYSSQLKSLKLNLPPKAEQTKIANFLSSIDKKIEQVNRQIEESKGFKKGLLQQMFV